MILFKTKCKGKENKEKQVLKNAKKVINKFFFAKIRNKKQQLRLLVNLEWQNLKKSVQKIKSYWF